MPNEKQMDERTLGSWRVRACAAGLCVGTQIFLSGCAVGMPLALTGAWLCAIPSLLFAAWLCARCRRALGGASFSRAYWALLALTLLGCGAFAASSLVGFAANTLVEQANHAWTEILALSAAALCALSGGTGVPRLSFAVRYALPALVLGLSLAAAPMRVPAGLFPIMGAGIEKVGGASLVMLFGAAPALMLLLPPPELAQRRARDESGCVPQTRFFLARVLAGAGLGAALLFLTCACTTYEAIAKNGEWSARLSMTAVGARHEGVRQMLLMTAKLLAMLLLTANMLCAAEQALVLAFPVLRRRRAGLIILVLLLGLSLAVRVLWGDAPVLLSAPVLGAAALLLGIFAGKGRQR